MFRSYNPFLNILPKMDLHGYNRDMVKYRLDVFINDNIKLRNKKIVGKGEGIIKDEVHRLLKRDNRVKYFYLDSDNIGETIIELK